LSTRKFGVDNPVMNFGSSYVQKVFGSVNNQLTVAVFLISRNQRTAISSFFWGGREENKTKQDKTNMHQRTTGSSYFKPVNAPMVFMKEPVFL
jgi:hypothetical protein